MSVVIGGASQNKGVMSSGSSLFPKGRYVFKIEEVKYTAREDRDLHSFQHKFLVEEGPRRENGKSTEGKTYVWFNNVPMETHPKFSQEWLDTSLGNEVALCHAVGLQVVNDVIPVEDLEGETVVAYLDVKANRKTGEMENVVTGFEVDKG